ncbi:MAG: hypothetical protein WCL71_13540 [Deltaproteobacteria bacterium]
MKMNQIAGLLSGILVVGFTGMAYAGNFTPDAEPGTMMLLSFVLFGLAIYGKRSMHKEAQEDI